jgi:hypothetical protein
MEVAEKEGVLERARKDFSAAKKKLARKLND